MPKDEAPRRRLEQRCAMLLAPNIHDRMGPQLGKYGERKREWQGLERAFIAGGRPEIPSLNRARRSRDSGQ